MPRSVAVRAALVALFLASACRGNDAADDGSPRRDGDPSAPASGSGVLSPDASRVLLPLLQPAPGGDLEAAGFRLDALSVASRTARARFLLGDDGAPFDVVLRDARTPCPACVPAGAFQVEVRGTGPGDGGPDGNRLARILSALLESRDLSSLWTRPVPVARPATASWGATLASPAFVVPVALRALWILVLLGWAFDAYRQARRGPWTFTLFQGMLFLCAAGLDLSLATFGPGDLHWNQAPFYLSPYGYDSHYGSAPGGLLRLAFLVLPRTFDTSVVLHLALGALAPVLAVSLARTIGMGRASAAATGILLAAQPLAVRFAGEGDRQAYVLALSLAVLLHLARHRRDGSRVELARGAFAAVLCLQSRPEGILVLLPALLFTLSASSLGGRLPIALAARRFRREALAHVVFLALLIPLALIALGQFSEFHAGAFGATPRSPIDAVWLNPEYTAPVAIALVLAGAVGGGILRDPVALWAVLSLAAVSWYGASFSTQHLKLASARYQALTLPLAALVGGYGIDALARLGRRVLRPPALADAWRAFLPVALLCALALSTLAPMGAVVAPRTIDHEFRFLLRALPDLPPDAEIFHTYASDRLDLDLGLRAPIPLSAVLGLPHQQWRQWRPDEVLPPSSHPRFYFQQATCYATHMDVDEAGRIAVAREWTERCRQAMDRYGDSPFRVQTVPAGRYGSEVYQGEELRIGFYRMP